MNVSLARKVFFVVLSFLMVVGLSLGSAAPAAAQEHDRRAHVTVTITETGLNIERPFTFEAALYTGTEPGEETSGRLTQWVADVGGEVNIRLPLQTLEDTHLPWDQEDEVYVRVRTTNVTELNPYPVFDMVSESFTLEDRLYTVEFATEHSETTVEADHTAVELVLEMQGSTFDAIGPWELSLYARHDDGSPDECYTVFKPSVGGTATVNLPEDVEEGEFMRWDAIHYAHVRTMEDVYPYIELAGSHFILHENEMTSVYMNVSHSVTDEELPEEDELVGVDDYVVYTVVRGDTLSAIASHVYGTSTRYPEIVAATNELAQVDTTVNSIANPDLIGVGWRIVIPDPVTAP